MQGHNKMPNDAAILLAGSVWLCMPPWLQSLWYNTTRTYWCGVNYKERHTDVVWCWTNNGSHVLSEVVDWIANIRHKGSSK